ncbi:MAG: hypothetical protein ACKVQA_26085, partial [Burkholderiales bacterium]
MLPANPHARCREKFNFSLIAHLVGSNSIGTTGKMAPAVLMLIAISVPRLAFELSRPQLLKLKFDWCEVHLLNRRS